MKTYQIALIAGILLFAILTLSSVNAAISIVSPVAGSNNSGSKTFNCSFATTDVNHATNVSFYYNKSGTWTLIAVVANTSLDPTSLSTTVTTSSLTDGVYSVNCSVNNQTAAGASVKSAKNDIVTFDNTAPTCTSSKTPSGDVEYATTATLTCSCTDTIDSSPTITRSITEKGQTATTVSTTPYTATASDLNTLGSTVFGCYAVDDSGNYGSKNITFTIGTEEDEQVLLNNITIPTGRTKTYIIIIAIIVIATIVVGTVALFESKKKKRRR